MIHRFFATIFSLLLVSAAFAGDATGAQDAAEVQDATVVQNSGFLGDDAVYARLEDVKINKGSKAKRWIGPSLSLANYQKVLIDNVVLYPEPSPGPQVSAETLDKISAYLSEKLKEKVGAVLNLAEEAGPGVMQLQVAVTGVAIKTEGMKVYEVLPVAAIFGGVKAMTGRRDRDVHVFLEARMLDSQTGELIGAAMRRVEGEDLKGKKDQLSLADMQPALDQITDEAASNLSGMLEANPQ